MDRMWQGSGSAIGVVGDGGVLSAPMGNDEAIESLLSCLGVAGKYVMVNFGLYSGAPGAEARNSNIYGRSAESVLDGVGTLMQQAHRKMPAGMEFAAVPVVRVDAETGQYT